MPQSSHQTFVPSLRADTHIAVCLAFGTDDRGRHFKQEKGQEPLNKLVNIDKIYSTQLRDAKIFRKMQKNHNVRM